ncbi:MAG TPA: GNAT family N-acetyltransferase [Tepidiformaceae bacterium]|nr:GNAT family N-acetyltransferase [Tepidiformaceae bacterium]
MVHLEPITPQNYEAALQLSPAPGQETFVATVERSLADAYAHREEGARALAAIEGETVVGFVLLFPTEHRGERVMLLVRLLVDRDHQGRGIGTAILDAVIEEARRHEPQPAMVKLTVVPENARAIRLYERFGFAGEEMEDGERVMLRNL